MALHVVVIRLKDEKVAHGHIVDDTDNSEAVCGVAVPAFIRETWDDPRNSYKNRANVTCTVCLERWVAR